MRTEPMSVKLQNYVLYSLEAVAG